MAEQFLPEIESQMFIKPVEAVPQNIEGVLTQSQLEEFDERDRPVLLAISKLEYIIRWQNAQFVIFVGQSRQSEAALIKKTNAGKRACLWLGGVVIAAIIVAVVNRMFGT